MGYRLHVASRYDVEYSGYDAFNHKCEEFHSLLSVCGADYTGESWDSEFEVSKDDWKKVIAKLQNIDELDEDECMDIVEAYENMEEPLEDIISVMQRFLEKSEPNDNFMHLAFF